MEEKMDAVSLYVSSFSAIIEIERTEDPERLTEVHKLLVSLKKQLSCPACKMLLTCAMTLPGSTCGHQLCKSCLNGPHKSFSCDNCLDDASKFLPNKEMDTLIQCYKKMCDYTVNTRVYKKLFINGCIGLDDISCLTNNGTASVDSTVTNNCNNLVNASSDGNETAVKNFRNSVRSCDNGLDKNSRDALTDNGNARNDLPADGKLRRLSSGSDSDDFLHSRTKFRKSSSGSQGKVGVTYSMKKNKNMVVIDGKTVVIKQEPQEKPKNASVSSRHSKSKSIGCKCGLATAAPGKLTCYGQRCPCYASNKPCTTCKCRGCRNPRIVHGNVNDDQSASHSTLPLAANHSLMSMSKSNANHSTDEEASDIDVDN